ncbi:DUF1295 domain-containing protein [Granulicoccus sp. GXG6511]|uniref:DUF1295 domain-containing protein n=1 Tax=Granulicoccus sp. GXG6511 TaxID=3381351 RepID=UPI003D7F01B0
MLAPFPTDAWLASLPFVLFALAALIVITWLVGRRLRRFAIIDVVWGLGFVVAAIVAFVASAGHGDEGRRLLLLVITAVWGLRLAGYLAWRQRDGAEDPRYVDLLERAPEGKGELHMLTKVYAFQLIVMFLVAMVQIVGMFATGPLTWVAWVGVGVWVIGMFFETVGDAQLAAFKADPANRGAIMDRGVWAWTRHPNYFGDTAVWWGLFLIAASSWPGVLTILSPVLMTWALAFRTGKPLTEQRMAGRPGWAEYARRTSGFVPLPPKRR